MTAMFHYVPRAQLVEPPASGFVNVMRDRFWIVRETDGALLFWRGPRVTGIGSPQCNRVKAIVERIASGEAWPRDTRIEQVPIVFVPVSLEDYER